MNKEKGSGHAAKLPGPPDPQTLNHKLKDCNVIVPG